MSFKLVSHFPADRGIFTPLLKQVYLGVKGTLSRHTAPQVPSP